MSKSFRQLVDDALPIVCMVFTLLFFIYVTLAYMPIGVYHDRINGGIGLMTAMRYNLLNILDERVS